MSTPDVPDRRLSAWADTAVEKLRTESGSALLLVAVSLIALLWANSPLSDAYFHLWETPISVDIGDLRFDMNLHHWINDGLMVVFFFLIGLEVRQEFAVGSLQDRSRAMVPLIAGLAGVALPALIYLAIAGGTAPAGWGVVVGTDTAFLLGMLAILGPRMSSQLRVFLLTLTVVDDFLAVAVIGTVYTEDLNLTALGIALAGLVLLWLVGRSGQWRSGPYVLLIVVIWAATIKSGVHPSLIGMAAGLMIPSANPDRADVVAAKHVFRDYWQAPAAGAARIVTSGVRRSISVNERMHESLRGVVSLVVVPIFALANAGIDLRGDGLGDALRSPITWAVVAGLVLGKFVGISAGTWLSVRFGLGKLPDGVGRGSVLGGAALSGIGFTMALLIISLAFDDERQAQAATVGVLIAMVLSLLLGWAVFRIARVRWGETSADLPVTLEPAVHGGDHAIGEPDAPYTVVEYLDFECPFCARATGMGRDLQEHFGDDIRYVVRHLPLEDVHPHAFRAAVAAEAAAQQGAFWHMHDMLFTHQDRQEPEDLRRYAEEIGLDLDQYDAAVADPELAELIRRHQRSAHDSGARGTPTFFLNGVRHRGPHDARTLIAALESTELASATRRRS